MGPGPPARRYTVVAILLHWTSAFCVLALIGIGIVLWALTWLTNRGVRAKKTGFRDIEHMEDHKH